MGFRCPACRTDFGVDRGALRAHLSDCSSGAALASLVLGAAEDELGRASLGLTRQATVASTQAECGKGQSVADAGSARPGDGLNPGAAR